MSKKCKYCLGTSLTKTNVFLSPCQCRGTVKYVHYVCFLRWILSVSNDRKDICPICHTIYKIDILNLELIPHTQPRVLYFLGSPILNYSVNIIIIVLLNTLFPEITFDGSCLIYFFQGLTCKILWIYEFLRTTKIKNKELYIQCAWKLRYTHYALLHISALYFFFFFYFTPAFFIIEPISSLGFSLYWDKHVDILMLINQERIILLSKDANMHQLDETALFY